MAQEKRKKLAQMILNECYLLLKSNRKSMKFRELLSAGWDKIKPNTELDGSTLANLYTYLNLDARFEPLGKGEWGLTEWQARPVRPSIPTTSLIGKTYQDDRRHDVGKLVGVGAEEDEDDEDTSDSIDEPLEEPFFPLEEDDLEEDEEESWDEEIDPDE